MHVPNRDQFCHAVNGGANLVPVYREIYADSDTPVSAYTKLGRSPHSFLLESVVGGQNWANYSFIGVTPRAVLRCKGKNVEVTWFDVEGGGEPKQATWQADDPLKALHSVMQEWKTVTMPGLPRFFGGAVGWISYDVVRSFENLPEHARDDFGLPDLCMVLTDTLVVFDNLRQTIKVVATPYVARPERAIAAYESAQRRIDQVIETLRKPLAKPLRSLGLPAAQETGGTQLRWGGGDMPSSSFDKAQFFKAVERVKQYILSGDVFQTVLSQRFSIPRGNVDPFDVYRALRVVNPSPYMFHLDFPDVQLTGASPETLVRCAQGRVEVRPIAGTRPRGSSPEDDEMLAGELRNDTKEVAEHLMLIDLGRNDVGRVSKIGTVFVSECMTIEKFSHVMHMTSHVHGDLDDQYTWVDAFRATFPAGTLTGAPKIRAMEVIDELEPQRRAAYGGAVGYVSYDGSMDFSIAIRTLVTKGDTIYLQAGAGIVHDSDPEAEYEETLNKARAILRAVSLARSE